MVNVLPVFASLVFVLAISMVVPVASQAQDAEEFRTAWGAPDIAGTWDFLSKTPLERPEAFADKAMLTEEEAEEFLVSAAEDARAARNSRPGGDVGSEAWSQLPAQLTDDLRTSLIVVPSDGRIPPLLPDAQRVMDARETLKTRPDRERVVYGSAARGPEDLGLAERCILGFNTGPPFSGMGYNTKVLVVQSPDYVVLLNEMVHDFRIVPLDGRPQLSSRIRQWLGDSRGHWDGETLVIESKHFTDKTAGFDAQFWKAAGSGKTLHLIERLTRVDAKTLQYEFTVNNPKIFTRSFTGRIPLKMTAESIYEYACHEGNYSMSNALVGARVQERDRGEESLPR